MIEPFHGSNVREIYHQRPDAFPPSPTDPAIQQDYVQRVISYGVSSYGYDIRLSSRRFEIFHRRPGVIVDPKLFNPLHLKPTTLEKDIITDDLYFILPAHTYGLGVTVEKFKLPRNIVGVCVGKSTYARLGILVNTTPAEPGWEGHLTIEISNSSDADCRIYANEGIAQMLFFEGEPCNVSYADRRGKYQNQPYEVIHARV